MRRPADIIPSIQAIRSATAKRRQALLTLRKANCDSKALLVTRAELRESIKKSRDTIAFTKREVEHLDRLRNQMTVEVAYLRIPEVEQKKREERKPLEQFVAINSWLIHALYKTVPSMMNMNPSYRNFFYNICVLTAIPFYWSMTSGQIYREDRHIILDLLYSGVIDERCARYLLEILYTPPINRRWVRMELLPDAFADMETAIDKVEVEWDGFEARLQHLRNNTRLLRDEKAVEMILDMFNAFDISVVELLTSARHHIDGRPEIPRELQHLTRP